MNDLQKKYDELISKGLIKENIVNTQEMKINEVNVNKN